MLLIYLLIILLYLCPMNDTIHRMSYTISLSENTNKFDCLTWPLYLDGRRLYRYLTKVFVYDDVSRQYCRKTNPLNNYKISSIENNFSNFTFNELRSMNITYEQLFQWNAPIDLIEEYISGKQIGLFVNCSDTLWFGLECEYTFDSDQDLRNILFDRSDERKFPPNNLSLYTNGTCYIMIDYDCESILCLDWREICDGKYIYLSFIVRKIHNIIYFR